LSQDFTLAAKHNGPYLSALPAIVDLGWFTVIAIVRNPLDVIHSWRSLSLRVSNGEMPDAVPGWPEMGGLVKENVDLLEKQVKMYDLMCQRLYSLRDQIHIVRYEEMLRNPNLLREPIGVVGPMDLTLIDKPSRTVPDDVRPVLLRALAIHGKHFTHFYSDL
jgi:hypothetical protein